MPILRVTGRLGFGVSKVNETLSSIAGAYHGVEFLIQLSEPKAHKTVREWRNNEAVLQDVLSDSAILRERIPRDIKSKGGLVVSGANFNSAGAWDFRGNRSPLEVIRQFLNDRHERIKDESFRNDAEQRALELSNLLLESEVVEQRVQLLIDAGVESAHIQEMIQGCLQTPFNALRQAQENGYIETAEFVE